MPARSAPYCNLPKPIRVLASNTMLTLVLILAAFFAGHSSASNSPALVSWQLDGNSRSTWDIVWTCFSTVFACTWTALHLDVPARNMSDVRSTISKIRAWFLAVLVPEVYFWLASMQLYHAISLRKMSNAAQRTRDNESEEPKLWLSTRSRPLEQAQDLEHIDLHPVHTEWTLRQCFCINANGLALQTQDEWIYTIRPRNMKSFIQAGIIRCSDFRDRDIEDRAKADSFAKAFTVLQSTWFLCNVIARWAYSLPVSPIELATVAYVACGILIYGMWWYKPKDMNTPITVFLRCDRENIPIEVRSLIETHSAAWVHLRARVKEEHTASVLWKAIRTPFLSRYPEPRDEEEDDDLRETPLDGIIWGAICNSAALLYCAIHIAAWNFTFPTKAERIAWCVFSLTSLAMVCVFCMATNVGDYVRFLKSKNMFPSFMMVFNNHGGQLSMIERATQIVTLDVYIIARLGMVGLVFSSLRALPAGSYTTIDWVTTIPHF